MTKVAVKIKGGKVVRLSRKTHDARKVKILFIIH